MQIRPIKQQNIHTMDESPISFTTLTLLLLLLLMLAMFACHFLGQRATLWLRSDKEEKIGLSNNKFFHANGYMLHSGSEFLLSSSGSFKRFDTIDKENETKQTGQTAAQQQTTPLWNLPQQNIPPQPLRPAPHAPPGSAPPTHTKTVKFSFNIHDELTEKLTNTRSATNSELVSCMRNANTKSNMALPQPISAPPSVRAYQSPSTVAVVSTAIPRPVVKRQNSLQQNYNNASQPITTINSSTQQHSEDNEKEGIRSLTRRNSNTNPFLSESLESLHDKIESNTALPIHAHVHTSDQAFNNNNNNSAKSNAGDIGYGISNLNNSNPFYNTTTIVTTPETKLISGSLSCYPSNATEKKPSFRNRSFSETGDNETDLKTISSKLSTTGASLLKLTNSNTNPFTGLTKRVKGPHLLQKTISEDFLFRKIGVHNMNTATQNGTASGTWSFSHSFLRHDSINSLGPHNTSQCSLDSAGMGSMDSINLERAISCDSVNSESSIFLSDLDQPYTQITGYLCVGLHYDKNSITNEGMELTVNVLEAKGLICPFTVDSLDTFVRIFLVPDQVGAMQTKVFKNSQTPCYNESFKFWLKKHQSRHSLWFHLYHNGIAHTLIGEIEMEIGEIPRPITTWMPLSDSRKCNAQWGELMFSLSYLPTAERLTIVVVKARNIKMEVRPSNNVTPQEIQGVFVKVYLMNNEKKVLKKRTSLKRNGSCPIFNESMIFSVPPHLLSTVQLRLTVFGVSGEIATITSNSANASVVPLGHVIAGSCSTGKGLRHWHQMLSSLRKPVAMWHVLRRAVNQPVFTGGAEAVVAAMQSTALRAKRNSVI